MKLILFLLLFLTINIHSYADEVNIGANNNKNNEKKTESLNNINSLDEQPSSKDNNTTKNIKDNNSFVNNNLNDNESFEFNNDLNDNKTYSENFGKIKIKEKIVDDEYINDRNGFMSRFGIQTNNPLTFNFNFDDNSSDYIANSRKNLEKFPMKMTNVIRTENIWQKDKTFIEVILGGGVHFNNILYVDQSLLKEDFDVFGYGSLRLKFAGGYAFSPELYIEETGDFRFTRSNLTIGKQKPSYNKYYLKIPLGFKVPFFKWKADAVIDASYSAFFQNYKAKSDIMVNNTLIHKDDYVNSAGSLWDIRFYLTTPVVRKESIIEYSYFGLYYMEHIIPKTARKGNDYKNHYDLFVSTKNRSGGIFYDLQKNIYKGFIFGINVNVGYAENEVSNGGSSFGAEFDNIHGLLDLGVKVNMGYTYIWKNSGVGLGFKVGAAYNTNIDFIFSKNKDLYRFGTEGTVNYFAELNLLFGY